MQAHGRFHAAHDRASRTTRRKRMPEHQKMNPQVKQQWLVDLRSGQYKQGTGRLMTADGRYCCLGVLADRCPFVKKIDYNSPAFETDSDVYPNVQPRCYASLNPAIRNWAGIDAHTQDLLQNKNDAGIPFVQIADWIEKCL
jgi:hypothetical protein